MRNKNWWFKKGFIGKTSQKKVPKSSPPRPPPFEMPKRQGVFCWEVFPIVKINYRQIVVAQECAGVFLFSHCFFPSLGVASLHRGEPSHFVFICLMLFLQLSLYFIPIAQRASPPQGGTISFCLCPFVFIFAIFISTFIPLFCSLNVPPHHREEPSHFAFVWS